MSKKILVFALLTLLTSSAAFARSYGASCGLADDFGDSVQDAGKSIEFRDATPARIRKLDLLKQQQLVAAARELTQAGMKVNNPFQAVDELRAESEASDVSLYDAKINHRLFTLVVHYPGGNPVGVIFAYGTTRILGFIEDSDIVCK